MNEQAWEQARRSFSIESASLTAVIEHIDKRAFGLAVDALKKAERIGASGCGHSGIACRHFAHLMCCIERPARFLSPSEAVHGGMGFIQKGDVLLLASRGGQTAELLPILRIGRQKGAFLIGVTENEHAPLAVDTDVVLKMYVERETDRYNTQGTSSFCVMNAIFDALQTALIEETGFRNEQFAHIHPGGAVGKRLNSQDVKI
jgi:D-arabinose 5-phosphate isomerase GutQ